MDPLNAAIPPVLVTAQPNVLVPDVAKLKPTYVPVPVYADANEAPRSVLLYTVVPRAYQKSFVPAPLHAIKKPEPATDVLDQVRPPSVDRATAFEPLLVATPYRLLSNHTLLVAAKGAIPADHVAPASLER